MIYLDIIKYYLKAKTKYQIHSPKVYTLIIETLENSKDYYIFGEIEAIRAGLLNNHNTIQVNDLGAGSRNLKNKSRKISRMAKNILASPSKIKFLFLISLLMKPKKLLELGSGFGLSAIALSQANKDSFLYTIEGDEATSRICSAIFKKKNIKNVGLVNGRFDDELKPILSKLGSVDLVLIDGNHTYDDTLNYFNVLCKYCHKDSVLIFDDIYWSEDMVRAWKEIENSDQISYSIDIFNYGLVFFDPSVSYKRNYRIIKSKWKPFSMGFWS